MSSTFFLSFRKKRGHTGNAMRNDDSKPIPTRFSSEEVERIDSAAQSLGLGRSAFIRFCVNMFLRAFAASGETVLPRNWQEIVQSLDNRTRTGNGARWPKKGKAGIRKPVAKHRQK